MRLKNIKRDNSAVSKTTMAIFIVVLLVASTSLAVVLSFGGSSSAKSVASGDTVIVNYTGFVEIQGQRKIFDTSLWDRAVDNTTFPKVAWFTARAQTGYTTFSFVEGRNQVIVGFDQGVLGMTEGQVKQVSIPPEQGYGKMDATKLTSFNLEQTSTVFTNSTIGAFKTKFTVPPTVGLTITDPVYKWNVTVLSVDTPADKVVYQNAPYLNGIYHIYGSSAANVIAGWDIKVSSIDSTANGGEGLISFSHQLNNSDSWNVRGYIGTTMFVLIDIDTTAKTAVRNSNDPLKGQTLIFEISMVTIKKA
jgi:FKBP-type peptidyl-prolyl cis-trans isomerase 2